MLQKQRKNRRGDYSQLQGQQVLAPCTSQGSPDTKHQQVCTEGGRHFKGLAHTAVGTRSLKYAG